MEKKVGTSPVIQGKYTKINIITIIEIVLTYLL